MARKQVKKKKEPKDYDMFVCRVPSDMKEDRQEFESLVKRIQDVAKANGRGRHYTKAELVMKGCLTYARATLKKLEAVK